MSRKKRRAAARAENPPEPAKSVALPGWLPPLLLLLATLVAYLPVWQSGYIWDDNFHVTQNPTLRDLHGLWRIWSEVAATPQYYPLVHTSFWLEFHLWGLHPLGYHLVNLALHAGGAWLLWRLLVRLELPGAWLAAAIFALHPVQVESVAWITERKNVLSAVFYFAAAGSYLRFARIFDTSEILPRRWKFYFLALGFFLCALLSKTVTCSLPAALLLVVWWKTGRLRARDLLPTLPFFALGLTLGLFTAWIEKSHVGAIGAEWSLSFPERVLVASRALWFYAGKLVWPAPLTFIYPRWTINAHALGWWFYLLGALAVPSALWIARKKIGRGPLVAVLFFAGTLFPALGFANVYPFRYSFVADHFQYLASVGLIALAAVGLQKLPRAVPALVLLGLGALTWRQIGIYRDPETLWRDTVEKNPGSWMAQSNLAAVLIARGENTEGLAHARAAVEFGPANAEAESSLGLALMQFGRTDEAQPHFQKALELKPEGAASVHYNLGVLEFQRGRPANAIPYLRKALEIDPTYLPAASDLGNALLQTGQVDEALALLERVVALDPDYAPGHFNLANTFLQLGRVREAVAQLQSALTSDPRDPEAMKNLAWVLATSPDASLRDGTKAVELAQNASRLRGSGDPIIGATLAAAYAEAGRFAEARAIAEEALQRATETRNAGLIQLLRGQVELFREGQPFRDQR